jgi:hypothetical protein
MSGTTMRILFTGEPGPTTDGVLARLAGRGFGAYRAENLREARELLDTFRVDVVLATESLKDGRGYALADAMRRHCGTLMVSVELSESCLWLPVIERGLAVLGTRAFGAAMLEAELDRVLGDRVIEESRPRRITARLSDGRPDSDRTIQPMARRHSAFSFD